MSKKEQRKFINLKIKDLRKQISYTHDIRERQILLLYLYDFKNTLELLTTL